MLAEQLVIDQNSAGVRLDLFLTRHLTAGVESRFDISRAGIQRLITEGHITLNGVMTKPSARLKSNDRIHIAPLPPRETQLRAEALPLNILYEDTDCIVINKSPGIVVHPAAGRSSGTLVNALLHHYPNIAGVGGERRPGIVHRLDKDTSGVMVIAKNMSAYLQLVGQFKNRTVHKEYLALVWGMIEPDRGIVDRAIGRHRSDRKRMSSLHLDRRGREAITEWSVEERFRISPKPYPLAAMTLLRLRPRTGRTHQLRVHLADMGHPLIGDKIYGRKRLAVAKMPRNSRIDLFPRQALHAEKLTIELGWPARPMEFSAPLPDDFSDLLNHLRIRDGGAVEIPHDLITRGVDKQVTLK